MRTRSPERDKAFKLYVKSGKTMKNSEIANKLGVSTSQVAKWKSQDKWDSEDLPNDKEKSKKDNKSNGNKKGAPKGNKNAVGNGAPLGSQNALKHGGYSNAYWDTLDEEEKSIINTLPQDEESLLIDQIKLYTVRERRVMLAINKLKAQKGEQILSSAFRSERKRTFKDKGEEALYQEKVAEAVAAGERLPGEVYQISTNTENKQDAITRLESELTRIQRAKTQAIESLAKINLENQKIELMRDKNDLEIEDTDETDELIYG